MSSGKLDELVRIAMADPRLTRELAAIATEAELFAAVMELGRAHGIELTEAELREVARSNRRRWLERWLPW